MRTGVGICGGEVDFGGEGRWGEEVAERGNAAGERGGMQKRQRVAGNYVGVDIGRQKL